MNTKKRMEPATTEKRKFIPHQPPPRHLRFFYTSLHLQTPSAYLMFPFKPRIRMLLPPSQTLLGLMIPQPFSIPQEPLDCLQHVLPSFPCSLDSPLIIAWRLHLPGRVYIEFDRRQDRPNHRKSINDRVGSIPVHDISLVQRRRHRPEGRI